MFLEWKSCKNPEFWEVKWSKPVCTVSFRKRWTNTSIFLNFRVVSRIPSLEWLNVSLHSGGRNGGRIVE